MNVLQIRHVLCPMDLSPISMNALEWANAIARARSAELRMLHVVSPGGIGPAENLGFGDRDDIITKLRGALTSIDSDNRLAGAAIKQGDPGSKILQFARSESAAHDRGVMIDLRGITRLTPERFAEDCRQR